MSSIPFESATVKQLAARHDLVITGDGLTALVAAADAAASSGDGRGGGSGGGGGGGSDLLSARARRVLERVVPSVAVFARVAPQQKELIVGALNGAGHHTLMCGDGTNDVGALKRAHVGVSILNNPELEKRVGNKLQVTQQRRQAMQQQQQGQGQGQAATSISSLKDLGKTHGGGGGGGGADGGGLLSSLERALAEQECVSELEQMDPTLVQLGDASIASPLRASAAAWTACWPWCARVAARSSPPRRSTRSSP